MKFLTLQGKLVNKNMNPYRIEWDNPKKSRSKVQFKTKQFLKPYWFRYLCFEEAPVVGTLLKVDILNATLKIAVEIHGNQHLEFNTFFHNNSPAKYLKGFKNDVKKAEWLEKNGYKLIEIYENEVDTLSPEFFKNKFDIIL